MNVLVTGGAGFIGSNLVRFLLGGEEKKRAGGVGKVVNLDKLTYAGTRGNVTELEGDPRHVFVEGDIADAGLVEELMASHEIDVVMHLAAESHVDRSIDGPEAFVLTNVLGTFRLLEAFRRHVRERGWEKAAGYGKPLSAGGNCLFLQVSTDEVFGALGPDDASFTERSAYLPGNPYSATKAAADHLARSYHHTYGMPVVITNCSNNYGPRQFPEKLLPLMIRKAVRGEFLPVYGDGGQMRDWLHVDDHCRALAIAVREGRPGETYLIGGGEELRNLEVVREVVAAVAEIAPEKGIRSAEELIRFVEDRPGHDRRYAIDSSRFRAMSGWRPEVEFKRGLRETVRWYLDHWAWLEAAEKSGGYGGERLGKGG